MARKRDQIPPAEPGQIPVAHGISQGTGGCPSEIPVEKRVPGRGVMYSKIHTHPRNVRKHFFQGTPVEMRLLRRVLHIDHIEELQCMYGRIAENGTAR